MLTARRVLRVAAPATAVAMAAGVMLAVDKPAEPSTPPPQTLRAASDALRIAYPSTWRPSPATYRLSGVPLRDSMTIVRSAGGDGEHASRVVAGMIAETDPGLLPPRLERRLRGIIRAEPVRLGAHQAYRYRNVPLLDDDETLTLFVIPSSRGTAMVACTAPRLLAFVETVEGPCEAMAASVEFRGARSLPLGPDVAYARSVSEILAAASAERRLGRARLRMAKRHNGQARRATYLARGFRHAARRLQRRGPAAGTATIHADLLIGLRAVADSYDALAAGAFRADRADYNSARRRVTKAEARLRRTLLRMRWLGYRVRPGVR